MPGFNKRGPMGQGPMTGRRTGRCTNFGTRQNRTEGAPDVNDNLPNGSFGRGSGRSRCGSGRGRGMGLQNRFHSGN